MTQDKDMARPITEIEQASRESGIPVNELSIIRKGAKGTPWSPDETRVIQEGIKREYGKGIPEQPQIPQKEQKSNISPFVKGAEIGVAASTAFLSLAACAPREATPPAAIVEPSSIPTAAEALIPVTSTPEATPTPAKPATPTSAPTETATPTPEIVKFKRIDIAEGFLVNGIASMGGGEIPSADGQETKPIEELSPVEYAEKAWGSEKLDLTEGVSILKFLVAEGAYIGADKTTYNLGSAYKNLVQNGESLRFFRVKINEFPNGVAEISLNTKDEKSPVLKQGTDITVIGTLDKGDKTLVSDTDYENAKENQNIPVHKFVVIPTNSSPDDPTAVSVSDLLGWNQNGVELTAERTITFEANRKKTEWEINTLKPEFAVKIGEEIAKQNAPEIGPKQSEKGLTYITEKGDVINIPTILGLKAEIKETNGKSKIVYSAEKENPYGLQEGEYAGEFSPFVKMQNKEGEQKQTGGIALKAPVALKLINEMLAKIPKQEDKWLIPGYIDITRLENPIELSFKVFQPETFGDGNLFIISLGENKTSLINIFKGSEEIYMGPSIFNKPEFNHMFVHDMYMRGREGLVIEPGNEMRWIRIFGVFGDKNHSYVQTIKSEFGDVIDSSVTGEAFATYGNYNNNYPSVTSDKIPYVGGIPLFVAPNTP